MFTVWHPFHRQSDGIPSGNFCLCHLEATVRTAYQEPDERQQEFIIWSQNDQQFPTVDISLKM